MATDIDDGGPAFPADEKNHDGTHFHHNSGITLRSYFAAHCPITFTEFLKGWKRAEGANTAETLQRFADFRYEYADAMLTARKPKEEANATA